MQACWKCSAGVCRCPLVFPSIFPLTVSFVIRPDRLSCQSYLSAFWIQDILSFGLDGLKRPRVRASLGASEQRLSQLVFPQLPFPHIAWHFLWNSGGFCFCFVRGASHYCYTLSGYLRWWRWGVTTSVISVSLCEILSSHVEHKVFDFSDFRLWFFFFSFCLLLSTKFSPPYLVAFAYLEFSLHLYLLSSLSLSFLVSWVAHIQTSLGEGPGGLLGHCPEQSLWLGWVLQRIQQTAAFVSAALTFPRLPGQVIGPCSTKHDLWQKKHFDPIFQKGAAVIGSNRSVTDAPPGWTPNNSSRLLIVEQPLNHSNFSTPRFLFTYYMSYPYI